MVKEEELLMVKREGELALEREELVIKKDKEV